MKRAPQTNSQRRKDRARVRGSIKLNEVMIMAEWEGMLRAKEPKSFEEECLKPSSRGRKKRTGMNSNTDRIQVALANIAVEDDYADWLLSRRGTVSPEADLEFWISDHTQATQTRKASNTTEGSCRTRPRFIETTSNKPRKLLYDATVYIDILQNRFPQDGEPMLRASEAWHSSVTEAGLVLFACFEHSRRPGKSPNRDSGECPRERRLLDELSSGRERYIRLP